MNFYLNVHTNFLKLQIISFSLIVREKGLSSRDLVSVCRHRRSCENTWPTWMKGNVKNVLLLASVYTNENILILISHQGSLRNILSWWIFRVAAQRDAACANANKVNRSFPRELKINNRVQIEFREVRDSPNIDTQNSEIWYIRINSLYTCLMRLDLRDNHANFESVIDYEQGKLRGSFIDDSLKFINRFKKLTFLLDLYLTFFQRENISTYRK